MDINYNSIQLIVSITVQGYFKNCYWSLFSVCIRDEFMWWSSYTFKKMIKIIKKIKIVKVTLCTKTLFNLYCQFVPFLLITNINGQIKTILIIIDCVYVDFHD